MNINKNMKNVHIKNIKIDCNEKKVLTFITWNVWFNEELKVRERMNAIGTIIKHDADIVCLQEVTPLILDISNGTTS